MRAASIGQIVVVLLSLGAFAAEPVISVDLHGDTIGVALHPFAAVAAVKAELAKPRVVYIEEAVDIASMQLGALYCKSGPEGDSIQDITAAVDSQVVTQEVSAGSAIMAAMKTHPAITASTVGGVGVVGYFLGKELFGGGGGDDGGDSYTTYNITAETIVNQTAGGDANSDAGHNTSTSP